MRSYQQITREMGDQWVAALKRAEDAVGSAAESIRGKIDLPQIPVPEQFNKLNAALTGRLPMPGEIVQANFELTERLLGAQRDLALRLIGATESAIEPAEQPTARKAPAAKKTASNSK